MKPSLYILLLWPFSQWALDIPDSVLVSTKPDDIVLDQAYLVPEREVGRLPQDVVAETAGRYMYVPWPDSAAHMDDDGILNGISTADAEDDLDGVFVPVDEEA